MVEIFTFSVLCYAEFWINLKWVFSFFLYVVKLQMSVATETKVFVVIMFDRAARVLFGCSADEFSEFVKIHPFAGTSSTDL